LTLPTKVQITSRRTSAKSAKYPNTNGFSLTPNMQQYTYVNPGQAVPRIITAGRGNANIEVIKRYSCSEYTLMRIVDVTGFNYNTLINGDYKILLEPVAYMTYQGVRIAVTATEAALYDEQLGGGLRSKMGSLPHQNLPLAMFLETPDLGYTAWSGSRTSSASNMNIIWPWHRAVQRGGASPDEQL